MPKTQSNLELLQAIKAEQEANKSNFGMAKVFHAGRLVLSAKTAEEFEELKSNLIQDIEIGKYQNAYARYTFANGDVFSVQRKFFSRIPQPNAGDTIAINL